MSEVEKEVEETTEVQETESTPEPTQAPQEVTEADTPEVKEEVDYAAMYEEEKTKREKAELKIVKLRSKDLEKDEVEPEEQQEDIKSYVDQRLNEIKVATLESQYEAAIKLVSTNPDEQKLIRLHLESNNLSGSVEEQVAKAKALANYKTVVKNMQELSIAKSVKPGTADSSTHKPPQGKKVKLTQKEEEFLRSRGIYDKYVEKFGT